MTRSTDVDKAACNALFSALLPPEFEQEEFESCLNVPSPKAWLSSKSIETSIARILKTASIFGGHHAGQYEWRQTMSDYKRAINNNDQDTTTSTTIGSIHIGDVYTANQAGAQGPQSQAKNTKQTQIHNSKQLPNLADLATALNQLRSELRSQATDTDHDVTVGAIAEAESAARAGDGRKTIEHLKRAGKWALDNAVKIGIPVATQAIEIALGMKNTGH